jgi:hypothetical protein
VRRQGSLPAIVAGRIGRLRRDVIVRGSANAAIPIDGSGVDG